MLGEIKSKTMKLGNDITVLESFRTKIEAKKNVLMAETEEN
jgi:hypothetical protein